MNHHNEEEEVEHEVPKKVQVGGSPTYAIDNKLGKGGFGQVWRGRRVTQRRGTPSTAKAAQVAIKFEHKSSKGLSNGGPPVEWSIYQQLGEVYGIPKMHYKGKQGDFYIMVMDLLGPSLFDAWNQAERKVTPHMVACMAIEAITILQSMHKTGYVHGDVKPENFLLGPPDTPKANRLYLVDLGLATRWRQANGQHVAYQQRPDDFRGTTRYASVHAHLGRTPSRRDDLESLAYTCIFLLENRLPWQGHVGDHKNFHVGCKKASISGTALCRRAPNCFARFAEEVVSMKFEDEPKYAALIAMFEPMVTGCANKPICVDSAIKVGQKRGRVELEELEMNEDEQPKKKLRTGQPATQWITLYNKCDPTKQRYHYNVSSARLDVHVQKGFNDGLYISSVACAQDLWAVIMDGNTGFSAQVYRVVPGQFLPKDWIMEKWDQGFYITAVAGGDRMSSLVVMSKGTRFTQQSYKVADMFPFEWIRKKWKEGFLITSMATSGRQWAVVMSKSTEWREQVVEVDYMYPSEGIHRRWDQGFRITAVAATDTLAAFVLSQPKRHMPDETQETLRTSQFPSEHVKEKWAKDLYIAGVAYGRTVA